MSLSPSPILPYRLACLCDLRDAQGRMLLLHRKKEPNFNMVSPIGGKLDVDTGESPAQCAQREVMEEAGLNLPIERFHLMGMVSEQAFEAKTHWLMFVYRVLGPVWVEPHDMNEGRLDWFHEKDLERLPVPESDKKVIYPLMKRVEQKTPTGKPGFFAVHIDCRGPAMTWSVEQEMPGT